MVIDELLKERSMTRYQLSKKSGVPHATIADICSGRSRIERCAAGTLRRMAAAMGMTMDELYEECMKDLEPRRPSFENFKSTICHRVKDEGDIDFLIRVLEEDEIRFLFEKKWYPEALYLLAMTDYLSRENDIPLCDDYDDLRQYKLDRPVYPAGIRAVSAAAKSDEPLKRAMADAIPEFRRFNIIESEVRNVV